jgi:hypothetical protein
VQAKTVLASKLTEEKLEAFYDEKVAASIVGYVAKHFSIDVMRELFPALHPIVRLRGSDGDVVIDDVQQMTML